MAKVFIEESTLTKIGNSIRNKTGKTELIDPAVMDVEIDSIVSGGGADLPEEAFNITGNCSYRFTSNGWNWFLEEFGNKITTKDVTEARYMFDSSKELTNIPFTINFISDGTFHRLANIFNNCQNLKTCPKVRGTIMWTTSTELSNIINYNYRVRDFEDLFEPSMLDGFSAVKITSKYSCPNISKFFNGCFSMRRVPSWYYKFKLCEDSTIYPTSTYSLYYNMFTNCYALDEALDIPVWKCTSAQTENMFTTAFSQCQRLKNLTFETQADGTPIVTQWKTQTIDLTNSVGWVGTYYANVINYTSGITSDKAVTDDATYQALKDDPDWFAAYLDYSRYNHDSAVATINSLPDTSAYLATAGGTNTIKFKGSSGSSTDGGAINTLTEEEIAVATAKGWTVTLV